MKKSVTSKIDVDFNFDGLAGIEPSNFYEVSEVADEHFLSSSYERST